MVRRRIMIDACGTYVDTVPTKILLYYVKRDAINYRTIMFYGRFFYLSIEYSIVNFGVLWVAVRLSKVPVEIEPWRRRWND